jgi:hypothetical protein
MTIVTGHPSPVPRKPTLARMLGRDHRRIRRLEVNRTPMTGLPGCGVALAYYEPAPAEGAGGVFPTALWTPDLADLTVTTDTIGVTALSDRLGLPPGWLWWAHLDFQLQTSAPPVAGDFLCWSLLDRAGYGEFRYDPLLDTSGGGDSQAFGGTVIGASGTLDDGIYLGAVKSALGTTFTPLQVNIAVTALGPYDCQLYITEGG